MEFVKVNTSQVFSRLTILELKTSISNMETLYSYSCLTIVGVLLLTLFGYWLFYVPFDWTRDFTEVSFNFAFDKNSKKSGSKKRDIINRIRRLRKMNVNELPPPYPNGWFSLAESSQVKVGQSISVSCLGEQFVVYRTEKGEVHVLDAYCPHMGANLGVGGRVVGDNIECPFHQWSFRGSDGKCVNIPYSTCALPQSAKVKKWISREVNDFIFVWYHSENEEPWELPVVQEIEMNEYVYHGRNEFLVNCHIQDIPENGADLAHFTAVHNDSVLAGGDPKDKLAAALGSHHWSAVWKSSDTEKQLAAVSLKHSIEIFKNFHVLNMDVTGHQIGPSYVQLHLKTAVGPVIVLQVVIPVEAMMQKVIHRFYGLRLAGPFMKFFVWGESVMFERDMNVWNHKMFMGSPCLVKEDRAIKNYRNWYSQFYSENSKSFLQAKETLEW